VAPSSRPLQAALTCSAVVLAGGTSRRWGGHDKTARPLAGEPLLLHAVRSVLPYARRVAVVARPGHPARDAVSAAARAAGRPVFWTREEPSGGGPLAGLAAGLSALDSGLSALDDGTGGAGSDAEEAVLVLAGDLPFTRPVWPRLLGVLTADATADVALGLDPEGRRQPLLAAHRTATLRDRLAAGPVQGRPLRLVTEDLRVVEVPVTGVEALDLDTPHDAAEAERIVAAGVLA
jgi:molybdenum cofactor guanylyltransferase